MNKEYKSILVEEKLKAAKSELREKFTPVSLEKLFSMEFPEGKWAIEKLVPCQGITLLSGAPASFKTWLLLKMAIEIAKGGKLFGQFQCEQSNVLIIDEENHLRLIRERLKLLGAEANLPIHYLSQKEFLVSDEEIVQRVLEICGEKKIGVVFMDSLVRINNADENDASQMSEVFRSIKRFCQNNMTVVITHHERKEGFVKIGAKTRFRGSSDIQASVDCHLSVKRDENDKGKILVEQTKLREFQEMEPFTLEVKTDDSGVDFTYLGACLIKESQRDLAIKAVKYVLKNKKKGMPIGEIKEKVQKEYNIGERNTADAIKELADKKIVTVRKGEKNTKICRLNKIPKKVVVQKPSV